MKKNRSSSVIKKIGTPWLLGAVMVLVLSLCAGILLAPVVPAADRNIKLDAAARMQNCMDRVRAYKLEEGLGISEDDIRGTGMIGEPYTFITTTSGALEAKRTTADPDMAAEVVRAVRKETDKPLIVKLSPNVTDIASIAQAAEAEGADAVSMINTLTGMRIDINSRRPIIRNNTGGLSGSAVFPVAVRMVWQVSNAVKIPIIGMGGISTWEDAVEMLIAGATALQIGTVLFSDPYAPIKINEGLNKFLDDNGIKSVTELTGTIKPW